MEHIIKEIKGFRAVGLKRNYNFENGQNFNEIPMFWQEIMQNGDFNKIMGLMNSEPFGSIGISANMSATDFDYYIAVASSLDIPTGMEEIMIETQNYAIFNCTIDKIQEVTMYAITDWQSKSGYEFVENAPSLEIYPDENSCMVCFAVK